MVVLTCLKRSWEGGAAGREEPGLQQVGEGGMAGREEPVFILPWELTLILVVSSFPPASF